MAQVIEVPRFDEFTVIREYCTCPACKMVWTHPEHHIKAASEWVTDRYGRAPYQCPECHQWSRQRAKVGWLDRIAGRWREIIPDPILAEERQHDDMTKDDEGVDR